MQPGILTSLCSISTDLVSWNVMDSMEQIRAKALKRAS